MPEFPFYPEAISIAMAIAGAVAWFTDVPFATATALLLAGVAIGGFASYRSSTAASGNGLKLQRLAQRVIAHTFRVAIGTLVIAICTILVLRVVAPVVA